MILKILAVLLPALLITVPITDDDLESYRAKGDQITDATQAILLRELTAAMKAGGPPTAVAYCNSRAQRIMDSVSEAEGVYVRRTTDRTRNHPVPGTVGPVFPGTEIRIIDDEGRTVEYYRPIVIKEPCLACHGTPGETISDETMGVIREAYPNDKATGYKVGDLRGMWHLTFEKVDVQLKALDR